MYRSLLADLLDVSHRVGARNEGSCTAEEGVGASGIDQALCLSLLDGGPAEGHMPRILLYRQRLTSQRSLVNLQNVIFY